MAGPPDLPPDWPMADRMIRVKSRPHDWALWTMGDPDRPAILMLHGAGGSGHSFRHLGPLLAPHYRLIVPDLPGQGFTRAGSRRFRLEAMAEDIMALCATLGVSPAFGLGHSAGAAIALRLAEAMPLRGVVGINAALGSFEGAAGVLFPLLARMLAALPLVPSLVSRLWGNADQVARLLASTGSPLDGAGRAQYLALVQRRDHVEGTLGMMADWRLEGLMARLPDLGTPALLIASTGDKAVPARISREAAGRMRAARYAELPGFGHLVHEEAAEAVAAIVLPWLAARGSA